jgi:hypothetical protein
VGVRHLRKKLGALLPDDRVSLGAYVTPASGDPLREWLRMWVADERIKKEMLSKMEYFGFGLIEKSRKCVCAVRIWGKRGQVKLDTVGIEVVTEDRNVANVSFSDDEIDVACDFEND